MSKRKNMTPDEEEQWKAKRRLQAISRRAADPDKYRAKDRAKRAADPEKYRAKDKARRTRRNFLFPDYEKNLSKSKRQSDPDGTRAKQRERYAKKREFFRSSALKYRNAHLEKARASAKKWRRSKKITSNFFQIIATATAINQLTK